MHPFPAQQSSGYQRGNLDPRALPRPLAAEGGISPFLQQPWLFACVLGEASPSSLKEDGRHFPSSPRATDLEGSLSPPQWLNAVASQEKRALCLTPQPSITSLPSSRVTGKTSITLLPCPSLSCEHAARAGEEARHPPCAQGPRYSSDSWPLGLGDVVNISVYVSLLGRWPPPGSPTLCPGGRTALPPWASLSLEFGDLAAW